MLVFFILALSVSCGFCYELTGFERIIPSAEKISRCVPKTMQESVNQSVKQLKDAGKIISTLRQTVMGPFAKNCKKLAKLLRRLDIDELLSEENITSKFSAEDTQTIFAMLNDKNTGLKNFLYIMENLELHLGGYIAILHSMLNMKQKLDIIDLIHSVDLIQRGALELQENFQLLSYLSFARENINGYDAILAGMRHQFSFKITEMITALCAITEDLRVTYLSLLAKGDCNGDQIALALGINQKKIDAIADEDS